MAHGLGLRVCIKPGLMKVERPDGRWDKTNITRFVCGKVEGMAAVGGTQHVLVRVKGQRYAAPLRRMREYNQFMRFRP